MEKYLKKLMEEKILILDGAMGTMIQKYDLEEEDFRGNLYNNKHKENNILLKGNNDLLSLTRPDIIKEIHKKYLDAGSDIIETNTFSGTTIAQHDYLMEDQVYNINYESAKIAKEMPKKEIPVVRAVPVKKEEVVNRLKFNDKDSVLDMGTNKSTEVEAPKTLERLEKISKENNERRKAEEAAYDDEDDEDDERLRIFDDANLELDKIDVHNLNKKMNLKPDPILDDIEVLG